ncbi:hypothetical protein [Nitrosomonas communis]|uniref:hypothetical protein n=1 Tax=Nitrosomonas communis TaxID=44574 RepID=UPI003D2C1418
MRRPRGGSGSHPQKRNYVKNTRRTRRLDAFDAPQGFPGKQLATRRRVGVYPTSREAAVARPARTAHNG